MIWEDRQSVHILMNMCRPPAEGNFCEEHGKAQKPIIVEGYSWHMVCVIRGDRMVIIYLGNMEVDKKNYFFTSWT
jgi:hypothetical protein